MNQPIILSNLLHGQRPQENQRVQNEQPENNQNPDVTLEISGSGNASEEEGNPPTPSHNPPTQSNTPNSSLAAINQFLEQNPELSNILRTFLSYIPFLVLILIKEIYKHTSGKPQFYKYLNINAKKYLHLF